jgi:aminoglycoside 3-N-acetyltransferase
MDRDQAVASLARDWQQAGMLDGDMVLVHSSVSRTLKRIAAMGIEPSPEIVLDSLLAAVGPGGTLLFPLFNFEFTTGKPFDIRSTPSQMGALSEAARNRAGAVRTGHPIYSFAVLGARAGQFRGRVNASGYGPDSPFADLRRDGGKIAVLDLPDLNSMTFYHFVEESFGAPYRYHKQFTGTWIDEAGEQSTRTFGLFVRDLEKGVRTHVDPMGEVLWEKGCYTGDRPKEGKGMRVIRADTMYEEVFAVLESGRALGLLYAVE